jgi:drug/metabolite transporter (DMT)-like permease
VSNAVGLNFILFEETKMRINRMAGLFLLIFGVINVLQEIHLRNIGLRQPGLTYAITTALFFTFGAALLLRGRAHKSRAENSDRSVLKLT